MSLNYTGKIVNPVPPGDNPDYIAHGAACGRIALAALEPSAGVGLALPPANFEIEDGGRQIYDLITHLHHLTDRYGWNWKKDV